MSCMLVLMYSHFQVRHVMGLVNGFEVGSCELSGVYGRNHVYGFKDLGT